MNGPTLVGNLEGRKVLMLSKIRRGKSPTSPLPLIVTGPAPAFGYGPRCMALHLVSNRMIFCKVKDAIECNVGGQSASCNYMARQPSSPVAAVVLHMVAVLGG